MRKKYRLFEMLRENKILEDKNMNKTIKFDRRAKHKRFEMIVF